MAYDEYGAYSQPQRPIYNQPPHNHGQSRGPPLPVQQRSDPYARQAPRAGYEQDRYGQQNNARVESYVGYDDGDILDQYGTEEQDQRAHGQQYNSQYNHQGGGYGGYSGHYDSRGPPTRPSPEQYRGPAPRRDEHQPSSQGYGNGRGAGMNRPFAGPDGPSWGPPSRGYPPQQEFGPLRRAQTAPHGYDDAVQYQSYGQSNDRSPPWQKPRDRLLMQPTSPKTMPYDNPFPVFPSQSRPANGIDAAERARSGMSLSSGRPSQEGRRPPTSNSSRSQASTPGGAREYNANIGIGGSRRSHDDYGASAGSDAGAGAGAGARTGLDSVPQRSMTIPQNYDLASSTRNMQLTDNGYNTQGYDDMSSYGRGLQDPIPQRSFTSVGEMRGPMLAPQRPSTATGMRQQAGTGAFVGAQLYANESLNQPPPLRNFMPQRPGTSQGYRDGRAEMQRPDISQGVQGSSRQQAMLSKEAQLEAYMPDFDSQPPKTAALHDAVGLPIDGSPEAGVNSMNVQPGTRHDMHRARSQPNLREQADVYGANDHTQEPVPILPPMNAGSFGGAQGQFMPAGQQPQIQSNTYSQNPTSPRQFHRPGAPAILPVGTTEKAWSGPGVNRQGTSSSLRTGAPSQPVSNVVRTNAPSRGVPIDIRMGGAPQSAQSPMSNGTQQVRPANPDALPAHPTPVRPGLQSSRPGAADIRQQQASRISEDYASQGRPASGVITFQELSRLREAVRAQPQNQAQQLRFAKKLVEAAVVLADENGAADARTTQRNRENYVNEAYKIVKKLAANSFPDAIFYLADCHGTGDLGLSVDPKEAFVLYQSAAKLGHGPSAYRTAVCCEMGQENGGGTRKDPQKAVQWYRRGAALGDIPAMYKLGMILLKGHMGQQANLSEAIIWLERAAKAADAENPHALHELAGIFESAPVTGNGVTRDERYALEMYIKAAKFGYRNSQARLGQIYEYGQLGCGIDNRSSIHWYSKAAAQEDHDAELALSGWYLTGSPGVLEQNDQEAYLWARKAALAENPKAEFAMGYFSETGIGCPKSYEDAKRWYGRAAGHRYPKAKERLDELVRGGTHNMKNKERISRSDPRKQEDCVVM